MSMKQRPSDGTLSTQTTFLRADTYSTHEVGIKNPLCLSQHIPLNLGAQSSQETHTQHCLHGHRKMPHSSGAQKHHLGSRWQNKALLSS